MFVYRFLYITFVPPESHLGRARCEYKCEKMVEKFVVTHFRSLYDLI